MLHAPVMDLAYLLLRFMLSLISAAATLVVARYGWRVYRIDQIWRRVVLIAVFLAGATVLSTYDAIDNLVLRPHAPITVVSWLWLLFVDLPMPILAIRLIRVREERDRLITELSNLTVTDALTGLLNRRGFFERAVVSIAQARRLGLPVSLVMLDIDHFKAINDGCGHAAGDYVLRAVADCLATDRRAGDLAGRVGGEEFALCLFGCDEGMATAGAERVRTVVKSTVVHPDESGAQVTVSGGVAAIRATLEPEAALMLAFKAADDALYAAKRAGRDRIAQESATTAESS